MLKEAHDYLVARAAEACRERVENVRSWGVFMKRVGVDLPASPKTIAQAVKSQNLIEVINQCATIERLLDTFEWLLSDESGFQHWKVERCHPTTSSYRQKEEDPDDPHNDNDLIIHDPSTVGLKAFFEVSDVASDRDGNGKEKKDLTSLRILEPGDANSCIPSTWPDGRRFLAVSAEFAKGLLRRKPSWIKRHCHYAERSRVNGTVILEVCKGPKAS